MDQQQARNRMAGCEGMPYLDLCDRASARSRSIMGLMDGRLAGKVPPPFVQGSLCPFWSPRASRHGQVDRMPRHQLAH